MKASAGKAALLAEIERLKQHRPKDWQRDVRATLRALQYCMREDDYREVCVNGDMKGYETIGRKCRSTRISPPI
jgi:hypothetical protein